MICRAATREACPMIPPSSPAFLAEQQSIFTQRKTQLQLENVKCWRIYITCGEPVSAQRAQQFSSPAIPKVAGGQPTLRYGSLIKTELCLYQEKASLLQPFPSKCLEQLQRKDELRLSWQHQSSRLLPPTAGACIGQGRDSPGEPSRAHCTGTYPPPHPIHRLPPPYGLQHL